MTHTARLCRTGLIVAGACVARTWMLHWGATQEEIHAPLPGDDLVHDPHLIATRAITVRCPPTAVWPWIAQLGQGRGGFYSYDHLENLLGCDMHSASSVVGAWQDVHKGDPFRLHPDVALRVAMVAPEQALVVQGGVPMPAGPPPYDFSWAFVLRGASHGPTRLVVRERYRYAHSLVGVMIEPVSVASFVMTQKMLRGIRDRAETAATSVESEARALPTAQLLERVMP